MSKFYAIRYAVLVFFAVAIAPAGVFAQSAFDDPGSRTGTGAAGDLKAVADKVDAGIVALGSSSQVVVLLRNDDNKPLKTGTINLYPSSNITASIGENQCAAAAIQPSEICAISVQVKGLQPGTFRIEMLIRHEGRTKLLTTSVNGSIQSSGNASTDLVSDIEAIPAEIDFGALDESTSQVKAIILRNKTSKPIDIEAIEVEAGTQSGFTINSNCKTLQTGAACVASVKWEPQQKGPSSGTVIVRHSGATEITTVELAGQYDPTAATVAELFPEAVPGKGLLISSQEQVDFGSGVAQSSSITVSLVNVGDVPLTLTDIRMANAENGVRAEKAGCRTGEVLAPLEACPLTMTWEPVREGSIVDDIQISHTGARGILVMPIRGAATRAINKDAKAITIGSNNGPEAIIENIQPLSMDDITDDEDGGISGKGSSVDENGSGLGSDGKTTARRPASGGLVDGPLTAQDYMPQVDVRGVLDGYVITSYSAKRAIVSGPGGSRVVFDGEQTVIGGILWEIAIRPSAIEFKNGKQKVLLLFDKSLSSFNVLDAQSSSGNASINNSADTSTTTAPTTSNSATTQ